MRNRAAPRPGNTRASVCVLLAAILLCALAAPARAEPDALRRTAVVRAVEKARLSVVNISTEREVTVRSMSPFADDIFDQFFNDFFRRRGTARRKVEGPLGSGVIIDRAGYVVTNEHVVRRASDITLSLADGTTFEAELLAADHARDVALLKVHEPKGLRPVAMGTSSDLMLGEPVIALGNPFGFENSVTSGIVSALGRSITVGRGASAIEYEDLIQTSALINPGNSGGALLNINGELIGINSAVVGDAQGIGFAIPVDAVRDVVAELLAGPRVAKAWFGLTLARDPAGPGARVAKVEPDGPADRAGLKPGDRITAVDGERVRDPFDVRHLLSVAGPGRALRLTIAGRRDVRLVGIVRPKLTPAKLVQKKLGVGAQDISRAMARQLGLRPGIGVLVTDVEEGGPADEVGLKRNDLILQLGSLRVRSMEHLAAALQEAQAGEALVILIIRGRVRAYARITVR